MGLPLPLRRARGVINELCGTEPLSRFAGIDVPSFTEARCKGKVMKALPAESGLSVGLVMSGGGARAAYQVGVLRAIATMLPRRAANPFAIICGTSAGAINATSLASNADRFEAGVARLAKVWGNLHAHNIYRTDLLGIASSLLRCLPALLIRRKYR